jgi:hypothetical protein
MALAAVGAPGRAELPEPSAEYQGHQHAGTSDDFHVQLRATRSRRSLTFAFVSEERCRQRVVAPRVPVGDDGTFSTSGEFEVKRSNPPATGTYTIQGRFVTPHRAKGTFRLVTPSCDTGVRDFTAHHQHSGHGHHDHGPDIGAATRRERAQALSLLRRTRAWAARRFPTFRSARRQGYIVPRRRSNRRATFFHVEKCHYWVDGRILDPRKPESLVYWRRRSGRHVLAAFMYRAPAGRPEPRLGGPIIEWHNHGPTGATQMVHVWLTSELQTAYQHGPPVRALLQAMQPSPEEGGAQATAARHLRYSGGRCLRR